MCFSVILIIGAMHEELTVALSNLKQKRKLELNVESYYGILAEKEVVVAATGLGKVNAAMGLAELLASYEFSQVINIGMAGATSNYQIGDIVYIDKAIQYDFDLRHFGYELGEVPNTNDFTPSIENHMGLPTGLLLTQDQFQTDLIDTKRAYLSDMEGAALFQVANRFKVEFAAFKYVSDHIGVDGQSKQYQESEQIAAKEKINEFILKYLKG